MLRSLDFAADWVAQMGGVLAVALFEVPHTVAFVVTGLLIYACWVSESWQRTASILTPLGLSAWAQVVLLSDRVGPAVILYGVSLISAFAVGRTLRMRTPSPIRVRADFAYVALLLVIAAILRLYAIESMPWFVDVEPGSAFLQSLSPHGLARYVTTNRVLDDGFAHMLGRWGAASMVGPSIVALRLVSVFFGLLSVALCYFLVRLFVPAWFAFLTALLVATDAAHLFWSRIEASQIVAAGSASLVSGLLAVWLARTWSKSASVASMLWMPATRYFYTGALALPVLPILVVAAGVLKRESRRAALRVVPYCAMGIVLWLASTSLSHSAAVGEWKTVSPFQVYGRPLFQPHDPENRHLGASTAEQVRIQARRLVENSARLMSHMGYDHPVLSNWLMMAQPDGRHRRSVSAPVFALFVPAVGFLLGGFQNAGLSSLLLWLMVLPIPGLFSVDPEPRRVIGFLIGVQVVVGAYVWAVVASLATSPRASAALKRMVVVGVAFVALVGVASHFATGRQRTGVGEYVAYLRSAFLTSDAIFHNIDDAAAAATLVYGNAEVFSDRVPCFSYLSRSARSLHSPGNCSFRSDLYADLFPPHILEKASEKFAVKQVTYLVELVTPADREYYYTLRRSWPAARVSLRQLDLPPRGSTDVAMLSVDLESVRHRAPVLEQAGAR